MLSKAEKKFELKFIVNPDYTYREPKGGCDLKYFLHFQSVV